MRIGIFGGSFNPVHNGHVNLAKEIKEKLCLDKIIIVPSNISPQKTAEFYGNITGQDRFNMCKLAFENIAGFEISDFEIKNPGKSYTIKTLRHFKEIYPDDEFFILMGSDSFYYFDKWRQYEDILNSASLAIAAREDGEYEKLYLKKNSFVKNDKIFIVNIEVLPISSTMLRREIKNMEKICCYLNENVVKYIKEKKLYI